MEETPFKFEFEDVVQDTITKYEGTVVARTHYLNGCVQYLVTRLDATGDSIKSEWLDEQSLELIRAAEATDVRVRVATGGPQPTPPGPAHR